MQKNALCVSRDSVKIDFNETDVQPFREGFFDDQQFLLLDRAHCETTPAYLQLIPYVMLRNPSGRIFCYTRGDGGAEDRLHGKLSIGLGGHVDTSNGEAYIVNHLLSEGERELREEVGIDGELDSFHGLIYTGATGNMVDQVHLGLLTEYRMAEKESEVDALDPEKDVVTKGKFLTLNEILAPETFDRLEPWSQSAAIHLRDELSKKFGRLMDRFATLLSQANIESPTGITSFATQEVGAVLGSLGSNLMAGSAMARVYDDVMAAIEADDVGQGIEDLVFALGCPDPTF